MGHETNFIWDKQGWIRAAKLLDDLLLNFSLPAVKDLWENCNNLFPDFPPLLVTLPMIRRPIQIANHSVSLNRFADSLIKLCQINTFVIETGHILYCRLVLSICKNAPCCGLRYVHCRGELLVWMVLACHLVPTAWAWSSFEVSDHRD